VQIDLETFSKYRESKLGADWEWRIIGRDLTLKMRVQAKRVQRDSVLRIKHTVKSSRSQQRDLLIQHARLDHMKPVYCIYCSEPQRTIWTEASSPDGFNPYQTGCLLAAAQDVPITARRLQDIEHDCFPWHFLFDPSPYLHAEAFDFHDSGEHRVALLLSHFASGPRLLDERRSESATSSRWNPPTIQDLNQDTGRDFDRAGVAPTTPEDRERLSTGPDASRRSHRIELEPLLRGNGIRFSLVMDVQDEVRFSRT